jgi:hypothetical protein
VLRELDAAGLHDSFTVISTQALYAYEAAAGSHFLLELLASGDVDLLYDARQKMVVVSEKLDGNGLLGLLKKADKTFECVRENGYRAACTLRKTSRSLNQIWLPPKCPAFSGC